MKSAAAALAASEDMHRPGHLSDVAGVEVRHRDHVEVQALHATQAGTSSR